MDTPPRPRMHPALTRHTSDFRTLPVATQLIISNRSACRLETHLTPAPPTKLPVLIDTNVGTQTRPPTDLLPQRLATMVGSIHHFIPSEAAMAEIQPFRAYRYDTTKVRLDEVLTQPYDKISPAMQDKYYAASPDNLIVIETGRSLPTA